MTFGLSYFAISGDLQETVQQIERFGCIAKIELIEQILRQLEDYLGEKEKHDTRTVLLGLFEMLRSWKQEELDSLAGMLFVSINLKECIKDQLEKVPA